MKKIVEGVTFTKARFLRTTCKNCNSPLSLQQVKQEKKWCSKECNKKYVKKHNRKR